MYNMDKLCDLYKRLANEEIPKVIVDKVSENSSIGELIYKALEQYTN